MAIYKTRTELANFELSNGKTVDLLSLIDSNYPRDWVNPTTAPEIGTVAYVDAMGKMRRGVVVKTTKTKTHVAVTTQGAVDDAMRRFGPTQPIRVQIVVADTNYVRVAPSPEAKVQQAKEAAFTGEISLDEAADLILDATSELARPLVEADHSEALREDYQRGQVEAAGFSWDTHLMKFGGAILPREEDLTLNSQAGKVDNMNNDENAEEFTEAERAELAEEFKTSGALDDAHAEALAEVEAAPAVVRETTGSAVVRLLERVHERIRENHPEVPVVVIVTGSGADLMGQKWGHFRPRGWMTRVAEEGAATHMDEMFMAGETLAKGARQVLQTMLHESAHALAGKRGEKDTSRQGRWHNRTFVKVAEELGLEYTRGQADKSIGFSAVTLTTETLEEYADLLAELDAEIHLTVKLPFWLGGAAGGDGDGEGMGAKPRGTESGSTSNNLKLTCGCAEPNIIRASRKVADRLVVKCDDCDEVFGEK